MAATSVMQIRRDDTLYTLPPVITTTGMDKSTGALAPTPPLSPSASITPLVRPPTQGGGPLSSHPTTPVDMPGAWLSTSDLHAYTATPSSPSWSGTASISADVQPLRHDSSRTPDSPASAFTQRRGSTGVRKLLSLTSLRKSVMGSRNSSLPISAPMSQAQAEEHMERSASRLSNAGLMQGTKRSASSSMLHPPVEDDQRSACSPLRKRKSGSWFRRQSQMIFGQDEAMVDVPEGQSRPTTKADGTPHDHESIPAKISRIPESRRSPHVHGENGGRHSSYGFGIPKTRTVAEAFENPLSRQTTYVFDKSKSRQSSYGYESGKSGELHESPDTHDINSTPRTTPPLLVLPELDMLGGGKLDGGSLGGEAIFSDIGR